MKKTITLFVVTLSSLFTVFAQNNWISYKVDSRISVKFPSQPIVAGPLKYIQESNKFFMFSDDNFAYKLKPLGMDSIQAIAFLSSKESDTDITYYASPNGADNNQSGVKKGIWKGFTCFTFKANRAPNLNVYYFVVDIGSTRYMLTEIEPNDTVSSKERDYFLSSIEFNK